MRSRETIIFFLPLDIDAVSSSYRAYSATGKKNSDNESSAGGSWNARQLYLNPQNFSIKENKLVRKTLTKGGHVVQYWGEELPVITASGTTGSAGVEGVNVLRDIYRHEQLHYRTILADRQRKLAEAAAQASKEAEQQMYKGDVGGFFMGTADLLTGGAVSKTINGVSNSIDILFGTSLGDNFGGSGGSFQAAPTLASFAVNVDMYYQGEFYRGYFTSFSSTENAQEPGHVTYDFNFTVTRRTGKRSNFMPWHRNPLDPDGATRMAQKSTESKGTFPGYDWLSFPPSGSGESADSSTFVDKTVDKSDEPENSQPINRRREIKN
tara:strand:+ start:2957 stop:3925 length:969 start_codon:yes stop_codon:yes gene_type:complete